MQPASTHPSPAGDEKRISFENDTLTITGYSSDVGGGSTHLRVADWDVGTTERARQARHLERCGHLGVY